MGITPTDPQTGLALNTAIGRPVPVDHAPRMAIGLSDWAATVGPNTSHQAICSVEGSARDSGSPGLRNLLVTPGVVGDSWAASGSVGSMRSKANRRHEVAYCIISEP